MLQGLMDERSRLRDDQQSIPVPSIDLFRLLRERTPWIDRALARDRSRDHFGTPNQQVRQTLT